MVNLNKSHAVITGGGSGIGLAIAQCLASYGAKVTLMGRNKVKLEKAASSISNSAFAVVDVADPESVAKAFQESESENGDISILINNAGIAETAPFHRTDLQTWQGTLDVNLTGAFLCTQQVYPKMREKKEGRIINIASTSGLKGYAYTTAYTAAKHGLIGLTRSLALECANTAITVNAICPGFTNTEIVSDAIANIVSKTGRSEDEALAELTKHNPQSRLIEPEEVAETALWLCSEAAGSVTGQSIVIAGGEIM